MTRALGWLSGLLAVSLSGCAALPFEISTELDETVVRGNPLGGLLGDFFEIPIPLDVDLAAETEARDTGPASAVRLLALELDITTTAEPSGDSDDFAFVESSTIFVGSRQAGSTLPRVAIAEFVGPAADGARRLVYEVDGEVDLLPYINEGAQLTSTGSGTVPPDDVSFDGLVTLGIELF